MYPHVDVPVLIDKDVQDARAAAFRIAELHGIDEAAKGRVALVVTELAMNLARRARQGRLLIGCHAVHEGCQMEVIAIDAGPGMVDASRFVRDNRTSGNSPGGGLAGVRRLSTEFSIFSVPGKGTVVLSRVWAPAAYAPHAQSPTVHLQHAGVCLAAPGHEVSGAAWGIRITPSKASLIVCDGGGAGIASSNSSAVATNLFSELRSNPSELLRRARYLNQQRADASVAFGDFDAKAGTILLVGAGTVSCRIVDAQGHATALDATAGAEVKERWPDGATVILHSAGIRGDWRLDDVPSLLLRDPAVIAGWLLRDHANAEEDKAIVVLKRS